MKGKRSLCRCAGYPPRLDRHVAAVANGRSNRSHREDRWRKFSHVERGRKWQEPRRSDLASTWLTMTCSRYRPDRPPADTLDKFAGESRFAGIDKGHLLVHDKVGVVRGTRDPSCIRGSYARSNRCRPPSTRRASPSPHAVWLPSDQPAAPPPIGRGPCPRLKCYYMESKLPRATSSSPPAPGSRWSHLIRECCSMIARWRERPLSNIAEGGFCDLRNNSSTTDCLKRKGFLLNFSQVALPSADKLEAGLT